jgi:hypothetical protein
MIHKISYEQYEALCYKGWLCGFWLSEVPDSMFEELLNYLPRVPEWWSRGFRRMIGK